MANITTSLLTAEERRTLYEPPVLNDAERNEYFTLNADEIKALRSFCKIDDAVYFAISLAFFKLKYTLVNFRYRDVTLERQHVMQRYFPNKHTPRSFSNKKDVIARIENKVLNVVGFYRFRGKSADSLIAKLQNQASLYPRQRQLCKTLLNLLIRNNIAIPAITTIQDTVTRIWNNELFRIVTAYYRHTDKLDRIQITTLLNKTDEKHRIVSIKEDMKQFNTTDIKNELAKHKDLKTVFNVAKVVLPKLNLPPETINYYASLVNYYNGARLKQLNQDTMQLYLLCYSYSRYQIVNDNLLEAFRKRSLDLVAKAKFEANTEAAKFIDELHAIRKKVHDLLMVIKNDKHKTSIPKAKLFDCIPESELDITAKLLLSDKLDKNLLFWQYIDECKKSITLNLRSLFLNLDISIMRDEQLKQAVDFVKKNVSKSNLNTLPEPVTAWLKRAKDDLPYIVEEDCVHVNRLEFMLYKQLANHIDTNKLVLEYSIRHKDVEDNFIKLPKWKKSKSKLLKSLPYPKLRHNPKTLLDQKERTLKTLYKKVDADIRSGVNSEVIIKSKGQEKTVWRLRPLVQLSDPNEGIFGHFPKRSIVDVLQFVESKVKFSRVFESILPRATKQQNDWALISAVVLANAIRIGTRGMAEVCDLNLSALLTAENAYVRMETLTEAAHLINTEIEKFEIFRHYDIDGIRHASLDGLKLGTRIQNIAARHSPKFLGKDAGVSAYNIIFNYLSLASRLISSNEYEGNFTFEMAHYQSTEEFKIERASTDKHGMNSLNFALFDLTDLQYAPRIPKPHNEKLWGIGHHAEYSDLLIQPDKMVNNNHIINDWDNMQRMLTSMLTGEVSPNIVISKMSSSKFNSKTKLAFTHYNHIVRSEFILRYIDNKQFRHAIENALNRGEAYNNLYRAITLLNGGKFRGQSEAEMMIWDQCSRLIAAVILYYNAYILNHLYLNARTQEEKDTIIALSPGAWTHINMLGYYQFCGVESNHFIEQFLARWDWQRSARNG